MMRRLMRGLIFSVIAAAISFGQTPQDAYRVPYKAWRETAAGLEKDAAAPSGSFSSRTSSAAKKAEDYLSARLALFLNPGGPAEVLPWATRRGSHPEMLLGARPDTNQLLTATDVVLAKAITSLEGANDPAIRAVRAAMERERTALNALIESLSKGDKALGDLTDSSEEIDHLNAAVARKTQEGADARATAVQNIRTESVAWARYYSDLAEGAGSSAASVAAKE
jgi:hypothetical protein